MGKDTSYVMFACIMTQLLKNNNFTVIAAHNLHTNEFCVPINTSKMSLSYSLTFLLLVWLQSYCRKWTKKGGHVVYANKLVKIKNLLHVFIIFFDIQNIVIDTLYVIFACRVTELLPEMDEERRPFCLCKLDGQRNIYFACLYHILWPSKHRYRHFICHICLSGHRVIDGNGPRKAAILFMQIRCST